MKGFQTCLYVTFSHLPPLVYYIQGIAVEVYCGERNAFCVCLWIPWAGTGHPWLYFSNAQFNILTPDFPY